jgi:ATP-dependent DNA ligase
MKERTGLNIAAGFIEPMLCLAVDALPEGSAWQYEIELDGYRAIGVRTKTRIELWSRNKKDFSRRFAKSQAHLNYCAGTVDSKARVSATTRSWNFGSRTSAEPSIG